MAPKSRRSRRISPKTAPEAVAAAAVENKENKPVYTAPAKAATVESFVTTANFARDVKWTGVVTFIIVVLIVIALLVIPH